MQIRIVAARALMATLVGGLALQASTAAAAGKGRPDKGLCDRSDDDCVIEVIVKPLAGGACEVNVAAGDKRVGLRAAQTPGRKRLAVWKLVGAGGSAAPAEFEFDRDRGIFAAPGQAASDEFVDFKRRGRDEFVARSNHKGRRGPELAYEFTVLRSVVGAQPVVCANRDPLIFNSD